MESGKLVNGFGPLIRGTNLLTNGSFLINQRESSGSWRVKKSGDFLCDMWQFQSTDVDYLELMWTNDGYMDFRGRGKKGQKIQFANHSNGNFPKYFGMDYMVGQGSNAALSMAVTIQDNGGSVPIQAYVVPNYGYHSYKLQTTPTTTKYATITPVTALQNPSAFAGAFPNIYAPDISIALQGTGEFYFRVQNARMVYGTFANIPSIKVHPSEDLLRCKRYYQSGKVASAGAGAQDSTSYLLGGFKAVEVEMAGTPSISTTPVLVQEMGSNTDVKANYVFSTSAPNSKGFDWTIGKATGGSVPCYGAFTWTATV